MTSGVYAVENTTDGRVYIGSSRNIERRWSNLKSMLTGAQGATNNKPLYEAWVTMGSDAFAFRVLEELPSDCLTLAEAETRWIAHFGERCYNILRTAYKSKRQYRQGPSLYIGVGEQILLARRRAKLTQRDLGQRLGVSHVAVGDIERGKTKPNLDQFAAIAEALDVPLKELLVWC